MTQLLNTRLTTATTLTAGANIPVGNIIHKSGCALNAGGNTIRIDGAGYYKVTVNVSAGITAAGDVTVSMLNNGTAISTATTTAAGAGDNVNLTLVGLIYNKCGCADNAVTFTISAAGAVNEMDIVVERM